MTLALARNRPLDLAGTVPEWIEILPPGPDVVGEDGRAWRMDDPTAVLATLQERSRPLVIDWEHASEHRAPQGLDAPAAGWVTAYELRDGAIQGQVEWTDRAAQQISAKEYRYLSPVILYRKDNRQIVGVDSIGLTNKPNLPLKALNREESPSMSLLNALRVALDLSGEPDEGQVVAAAKALKSDLAAAQNRAERPPLEKFVPRADFDAALVRASNAEQALNALQSQQRGAKIDALIDQAKTDRKITPATESYYRAMCQTENGIAEFESFIAKAPAVIGADSGLDGKKTPTGSPETEFAANAELRQVSAMFGNSIEDLKKYGGLQ